jgi:hypothetical protein
MDKLPMSTRSILMRFQYILAGFLMAAAMSACVKPAPLPTVTPTVTQTPAVVVEVTHFPTNATTTVAAPSATSTLTAAPVVRATSTGVHVITPAAPPPATSAISTVVPGTFIEYFRSEPTEINPGERFTLSWKVKAGDVTLWRIERTGQFGTWEDVALEGSKSIETSTTERNFVQYLLYVQSGDQSESQTLTVKLRCPDTWFMDNPPTDCPAASAAVTQGVYQSFVGGFMLWVASNDFIYVFYTDANSPRWSAFPDTWQSGMVEQDDSLIAPSGLFQPVRGFGKVWREQTGVRDRLGWATAAELAFQTAFQCNSQVKYGTCYIQSPIGVIVLQPEASGWVVWAGPTPLP